MRVLAFCERHRRRNRTSGSECVCGSRFGGGGVQVHASDHRRAQKREAGLRALCGQAEEARRLGWMEDCAHARLARSRGSCWLLGRRTYACVAWSARLAPGGQKAKRGGEYGGEKWYFARARPAGEGCYCIRRRARSEGRVTNAPDERRGQRAGAVAGTSKTLETRRAHMHPLSLHKTAYTARPALRASSQS